MSLEVASLLGLLQAFGVGAIQSLSFSTISLLLFRV